MQTRQLSAYYRKRAGEYDRLYHTPEYQSDLARLRRWLTEHTRDRTVLEVAAGTGYWTEVAARAARAILATDRNENTLAIAAKRCLGKSVRFMVADAYELPKLSSQFDVAMAHLWWSHVERRRRRAFLRQLVAKLRPQGTLLMIDENFARRCTAQASRRDQNGNRYETRMLRAGNFEIIKNYPTGGDLRQIVEEVCSDVRIIRLRYFWAIQGTAFRRSVRPA